ncbi:MAG: FAD-dependent oxidoreductase, partial [Candidatus Aureabacteria bacterium]|nr:FAD-dependent oxidoreductase [Candidatus Auribacterota bacterium]
MVNKNLYDVAIVGGGPAGLTAGIYTSRARLKTLLIEGNNIPSQCGMTDLIENYPGFPEGISGYEILAKFKEQAKQFGAEFLSDTANSINLKNDNGTKKEWYVETGNNKIECLSIIIAVGARYKKLGIPGEIEYLGKGVSYCATCDGAFFRDKDIVVVGGGDTAIQEALFLTRFGRKVTVVHRRDRLRAAKVLQERIEKNPKEELKLNSVVTEIAGTRKVESIKLKNSNT